MDKIQELYRLLLKEQWRVTKTYTETHYNVTQIHIYLEATKAPIVDSFLGSGPTEWHVTLTTYHL